MTVDRHWRESALCREVDPALFHNEVAGEVARVNAAKRVCLGQPEKGIAPCPVQAECLEWAIESNDAYAVLGGTSPRQRMRMRTEQRRANGGRVRCRVCRKTFVASSPQQMDCSEGCRLESRRKRERERDATRRAG